MKTYITWALTAVIVVIFAQSLFFKFSGSQETIIIFTTIAIWMNSIGVPIVFTELFAEYGGYVVGVTELIAVALLLLPATRFLGALLSLVVISSAIFFHLCTPLGIDRVIDMAGNKDGGALFYTACIVALSSVLLIILSKPFSVASGREYFRFRKIKNA